MALGFKALPVAAALHLSERAVINPNPPYTPHEVQPSWPNIHDSWSWPQPKFPNIARALGHHTLTFSKTDHDAATSVILLTLLPSSQPVEILSLLLRANQMPHVQEAL